MHFSEMNDLGCWRWRSASENVARSQIAGSFVNALLDTLLGIPPPQTSIDTRPTPQFVASCRQVYHEGHIWFYAQNTICLPRGPVGFSQQYFKTLQPDHKNLIHAIGIQFGLNDVAQEVVDAYDSDLKSATKQVHEKQYLSLRPYLRRPLHTRLGRETRLCAIPSKTMGLSLRDSARNPRPRWHQSAEVFARHLSGLEV